MPSNRLSLSYTLNESRFDGISQLSYLITNNTVSERALLAQSVFTLDNINNVPTAAQLGTFAPQTNIIRRVAPDLDSPTTYQAAISVERQLPWNLTMSVTYVANRTIH